jgi:hypothetical protein
VIRDRASLLAVIEGLTPHADEPAVRVAIAEAELRLALSPDTPGDEGITRLRRAIRHNPFHPVLHLHLGRLLHRSGLLRQAIAAYRDAIAIAPSGRRAYLLTSLALLDLGPDERLVGQAMLAASSRDSAADLAKALNDLDGLVSTRTSRSDDEGPIRRPPPILRPAAADQTIPSVAGFDPSNWLIVLMEQLSRRRGSRSVLESHLAAGQRQARDGIGVPEYAIGCVLLLVAGHSPASVRQRADRGLPAGRQDHPAVALLELVLHLVEMVDANAFVRAVAHAVEERRLPADLAAWLHYLRQTPEASLPAAIDLLDLYPQNVAWESAFRELRVAILDRYAHEAYVDERLAEARVIWQEASTVDPLRVEIAFNLAILAARTRSAEHYRAAWERLAELMYLQAAGSRDVRCRLDDRTTLHRALSRQCEERHRKSVETEELSDGEISAWVADADAVEVWLQQWDLYHLHARLRFQSAAHVLGVDRDGAPAAVAEARETMRRLVRVCFAGKRWAGARSYQDLVEARLDDAAAWMDARRADRHYDAELAEAENLLDEALRRVLMLRRLARFLNGSRTARQQVLRCKIASRLFTVPRSGLQRLCTQRGLIPRDTTLGEIFASDLQVAVDKATRLQPATGRELATWVTAARGASSAAPHLSGTWLWLCRLLARADRRQDAYTAAVEAADSVESQSADENLADLAGIADDMGRREIPDRPTPTELRAVVKRMPRSIPPRVALARLIVARGTADDRQAATEVLLTGWRMALTRRQRGVLEKVLAELVGAHQAAIVLSREKAASDRPEPER